MTFVLNYSIIIIEKERRVEQMNKYVDHLTIDEYKTIREQLKLRLDDLKQGINSEIGKRKYIETRFIIIKIDQIIKKYEKKS